MTERSNLPRSYEEAHRKARPANRYGPSFTFLGMDVVEVAPPYDTSDVTALLGNRVVLETLSGVAVRRKDDG